MTRRDRGRGSVYESSSGYWVAAIYLGDGKRVRRKRPTQPQAEQALVELLSDNRDNLGYHYYGLKPYRYEDRPVRPGRKGLSPRVRWDVMTRDGFRCVYCGATREDDRLVIDHVHPIAAGGTDDPTNLVTACWTCNAGKADRVTGGRDE